MGSATKSVPAKTQTKTILEYVSAEPVTDDRIDREKGIVKGIRVLGLESKNGRTYKPAALKNALGIYEGLAVNINHPSTPKQARLYEDRFGRVRNVSFAEGAGLVGDLHFNPKHALAEQFMWDAQHAPENVGMSHNADVTSSYDASTKREVVEGITKVRSVDLVPDPATVRSLFEQGEPAASELSGGEDLGMGPAGTENGSMWDKFASSARQIWDSEGEPKDKAKRLAALAKSLLGVQDDVAAAVQGEPAETDTDGDPEMTESIKAADYEAAISILESVGVPVTTARAKAVAAAPEADRKPLAETWKGIGVADITKPKSKPAHAITESAVANGSATTQQPAFDRAAARARLFSH